MPQPPTPREPTLRILHVLRSPVGGLFRHVVDLAQAQIERGHAVGIVADLSTGGATADTVLARLEPSLALGLTRFPMRRDPHPADLPALGRMARIAHATQPDVLHGHGSKGGLYARLPGLLTGRHRGPVRVYTPHGGSLHYGPGTAKHRLFKGVEQVLARASDLILFESAYAAARHREFTGEPACLTRVALNGLRPDEFTPVLPRPGAADFVYVGELRTLKGVDTFLEAFAAACATTGRALRAVLVGAGPDRALFEAWAERLGLSNQVAFTGPQPARQAFAAGRVLVVPSRAESLPYIVLEAAAAGVPLVATRVGGIPEIFGPYEDRLVPADDPLALAARVVAALDAPAEMRRSAAAALTGYVRSNFNLDGMVDAIMQGYRDALAARAGLPAEHERPARHPDVGPVEAELPRKSAMP